MSNLLVPSTVRTGGVALPKRVENEILAEQAQVVQEFYSISAKLEHFNRELRKIDQNLQVVLAKPNTSVMGLVPNYYHLLLIRPGHGTYIKTIEGPNGEWRDLDSSVFDLAAEDDLWNDRTQRERKQAQKRAEDAHQRQRDRERQDRIDAMNDRFHSMTHVSVSVPRAV